MRVFFWIISLLLWLSVFQIRCKQYKVYWNVPTITCLLFNISFTNLTKTFGITMNDGGNFSGNHITILYNPGLVPKIDNYKYQQNINLNDVTFINGGVPQNADMLKHLDAFEEEVKQKVPDTRNSGLIVIDIEEWGATWAQNFNYMEIYRIVSRMKIKQSNPLFTDKEVEREAALEYQRAATNFLIKTLQFGQWLRPKASWGYYQYPQCFNLVGNDFCSEETKRDNDQMILAWRLSNAVFPSLYLPKLGTEDQRASQIRGKVREGKRMTEVNNNLLVVPYLKTTYFSGEKITDADLENLIRIPKEEGADGVVIWGSYFDVNTHGECASFRDYVKNVLGPIVKKYVTQ